MQNNTLENLAAYNKSIDIAERVTTQDLMQRENRIVSSTDSKLFWSYVNRRLTKDFTIKTINHHGEEVNDNMLIANIFNKHFASNFTPKDDITSAYDSTVTSSIPGFDFSPISQKDVLDVIGKLPSKTSTDEDGLSYRILKCGSSALAYFLSGLFSVSLDNGQIPSSWKTAIVAPIHKNGPKTQISNYRPISVTSCCSRILERLVKRQMVDFLTTNNYILHSQHAFERGKSTDTALLTFYDYVTNAVDNNLIVDAVYFDFAKAFEKVPHDILLKRLRQHRITGKPLSWITNFLTNRTQKVRIGSVLSDSLPVSSGIIQGSVLGPTLFNIFINNVDSSLRHCKIVKYADDIRIFLSSRKDPQSIYDLHEKIQDDVSNITKWTIDSRMKFNVNKCFTANFGHTVADRAYSYLIHNDVIPNSLCFRDLGLTVRTPLSFNSHMDAIIARAFSRLGLINKLFHLKSKRSLLSLYKAYVRPILEFASIIWNPHLVSYTDRIERVQRRMCRMIPTIRKYSYRKQLEVLNILSLSARRSRFQLITVFKFHTQLSRLPFDNFFTLVKDKKTRGHTLSIATKHASHNYRLGFFSISIIDLWNKLPQDVANASNLNDFKSGISSFFRQHDIW
jgi:hypothetical protein